MIECLTINAALPGETEGGYERGDIVTLQAEGWQWGTQEDPATRTRTPLDRFYIITVQGISEADAAELLETWHDTSGDSTPVLVKRRASRFDFTKFTSAQNASLAGTGKCVLTVNNLSHLRTFLVRKNAA